MLVLQQVLYIQDITGNTYEKLYKKLVQSNGNYSQHRVSELRISEETTLEHSTMKMEGNNYE